jgi:putative hydrolase of the HAD superfamily
MHSTSRDLHSVILDYGMVLGRKPSLEQIDRMAELFSVEHATFWQLYEKNRGDYDKNEIDGEEYWSRFAGDTNTHLSDAAMEQLLHWDIEMWSNLEAPLLTWARSLRAAGFQTALLSNLHLKFSAHLRSRSEWLQLFDHLIFSSEVRLIKPDPAIFLHCLKTMGVKPEKALFIDDREANVATACAMGVRAIKYESVVQLEADLKALQFPLLPSLLEIGT